jgi:hypothetical protein
MGKLSGWSEVKQQDILSDLNMHTLKDPHHTQYKPPVKSTSRLWATLT